MNDITLLHSKIGREMGVSQLTWGVSVEREGSGKPVCLAGRG